MTIATGERLPDVKVKLVTPDDITEVNTADYFADKKVVLFGVPGAFTPTCSNNHLPGYLENAETILGRGIDEIAVIAVNDPFVMRAWARFTGGEGKITFIADGSAVFAKAAGLDLDMSAGGMGLRCKRFSMVVDKGVVSAVNVEGTPGQAVDSGAARMLEQL
ncbi:peroxiredoxin [Tianweitania sediminis]|uniref:Glutathione-dependent peroxiredoxin n=1 Tax=Tianweitania sediminis TaxID=1502156 RepID=A0A8J7RN49_9HYPH|nr:peroxiredoxin [Tianweitania sediminis]MBP0438804.1 peroxiredoxin [Tianweitania sediminis]